MNVASLQWLTMSKQGKESLKIIDNFTKLQSARYRKEGFGICNALQNIDR